MNHSAVDEVKRNAKLTGRGRGHDTSLPFELKRHEGIEFL